MDEGSIGIKEADISEVSSEHQIIPPKQLTRRGLKERYKKRVENARIEGETDELTGLETRRAFIRRLKEEAERIDRYGGESRVLILDADGLKLINDGPGGHAAGDVYLKSIADALRTGTRLTDHVYRYGGDEFAVILPSTDLEGTERLWTERLNPEFTKKRIAISAGSAPIDTNIAETIARADSGMYEAKRDPGRKGENLLLSFVKNQLPNG